MDGRKEMKIGGVKENKKDVAKAETWITERQRIKNIMNEISAREKQMAAMKEQQKVALKESEKAVLYLKEDLFFLLKGKDLKETKEGIDEHYKEVEKRFDEIISKW